MCACDGASSGAPGAGGASSTPGGGGAVDAPAGGSAPTSGAGGRVSGAGATGAAGNGGSSSTPDVAGGAGAGGQAGMATQAGSAGSAPDDGCGVRLDDAPIGFAAEGGGTLGGGDVAAIEVTTNQELQSYLADDQPRVLHLMNDLDFRTEPRGGVAVCVDDQTCDNGSGQQIDNARVSASCDAGEHAAQSQRYETRLKVASHKTLIGIGAGQGAAIRGAGLNIGASQQVILRNLRIYDINPHLVEAGDAVTLQESRHVWLDHLLLEQISDGYIDIGSSSSLLDDYITISFVRFNGRTAYQCDGQHHFVNFIDNGRVTYHHNFFDNGSGRQPKVGGASSRVHLFNNYWLGVSYFCITAQVDAQVRVDSNYFEDSARPHWRQLDGAGTAGIAIDDGNVYTGASNGNTNRDVGGNVFSVPYSFTKQAADDARDEVSRCSGPQPIH